MKLRIAVFLLLIAGIHGYSHPGRKLAWKTPEHIQSILDNLYLKDDANLPVPILDHEQPYTRGTSNTITWTDSMAGVYAYLYDEQLTIQFFVIEAVIFNIDTVWGFVDSNVLSATFLDLPEGVPVEYRMQYYVRDNSGNMYMSPWSRPEISIQDASAPVVLSFTIQNLQDVCGNPWVLDSQIKLNIRAKDMNGQVMEVAIQEISEDVQRTLFNNLDARPRSSLDTTLQYSLLTEPNTLLKLKCWVVDVAEFNSDTLEIQFFYQLSNPEVTCFPNPFMPDMNGCISIKVEKEDVREAKIFDPFGNLVKVLMKDPDTQVAFQWDGKNERGEQVSKGGYLCIINNDRDLYCKIAVIR